MIEKMSDPVLPDPLAIVAGVLFEDGSADYIVNSLSKVGLILAPSLSQTENYSNNTRKRAYQQRFQGLLTKMAQDSRVSVAESLAGQMAEGHPKIFDKVRTSLAAAGWTICAGQLVRTNARGFLTLRKEPGGGTQGQLLEGLKHFQVGEVRAASDRPQYPDQSVSSRGSSAIPDQQELASTAKAGTHVFIGHGRSEQWRKLKDFLEDRLHLSVDEFNRVSAAGLTTQARLQQMLDDSCFAFIVMTAEDQHGDGSRHARENVVHEAGLFQGRLGFEKAIILLEEGCEQFSNILGLTYISFGAERIEGAFEEVRRVLEREGVMEPGQTARR